MNKFTIPQELRCTASIPELTEIMKKLYRLEKQNKKILKALQRLDTMACHTSMKTGATLDILKHKCDVESDNESESEESSSLNKGD